MDAIVDPASPVAELDHRTCDSLDVTLFWDRRNERVFVQVIDWAGDDDFTIPVGDAPVLDVFHHPYAYAASESSRTDGHRSPDPLCRAT